MDLILNDYVTVLKSVVVIFISIFGTGIIYMYFTRKNPNKKQTISKNLILTVKSSGFAILLH